MGYFFWTHPQAYYDSAKWRGTWEFDGGAFMNQASHYIDLLDWMIGPVESVMAYTATLARNIEVEDSGVAAVRWRSGAMGTVTPNGRAKLPSALVLVIPAHSLWMPVSKC